jgi:hypothetical protein
MKYIGNYSDWVQDEWVSFMETHSGLLVPRDQSDKDKDNNPLNESKLDIKSLVFCHHYDDNNTNFKVKPCWDPSPTYCWWMNKYLPMMSMPLHRDNYNNTNNTVYIRYWVALEDYVRGHIMLYEDTIITGYKKGDVFKYENPDAYHAGSNLSWVNRYSLMVTTWEQ